MAYQASRGADRARGDDPAGAAGARAATSTSPPSASRRSTRSPPPPARACRSSRATPSSCAGSNLRGGATRVRIGGAEVEPAPADVSDGEIRVPLAAPPFPAGTLRAGVVGAQVVQLQLLGTPPALHAGIESNVAPFVLRPRITTAGPDPDVTVSAAVDGVRTVTVGIEPPVGAEQRAVLLLNEPAAADPAGLLGGGRAAGERHRSGRLQGARPRRRDGSPRPRAGRRRREPAGRRGGRRLRRPEGDGAMSGEADGERWTGGGQPAPPPGGAGRACAAPSTGTPGRPRARPGAGEGPGGGRRGACRRRRPSRWCASGSASPPSSATSCCSARASSWTPGSPPSAPRPRGTGDRRQPTFSLALAALPERPLERADARRRRCATGG